MNSLSWLIYAAGVVGNLQFFLVITGTPSIFAGAFCYFFGTYYNEPLVARIGRALLPMGMVACLFASLIPNQANMLSIAASEIGERAVTSEQGRELLQELKDTVLTQLRKARGEK